MTLIIIIFLCALLRQIIIASRKHKAKREEQRLREEEHREYLRQIEAKEAKRREALEAKARKAREAAKLAEQRKAEAEQKAEQKRIDAEQKQAARLAKLEANAGLAEVDVEYLKPILAKQEIAYNNAKQNLELYASAGLSAPEGYEEAFEKASKEYHATLKKYLKAQNIIEQYRAEAEKQSL